MSEKPVVLVTRRVPDSVTARLLRDFEARLNEDDRLYTKDELLRQAAGAEAILCCHTEHFTAEVIAGLPETVKMIGQLFGGGGSL